MKITFSPSISSNKQYTKNITGKSQNSNSSMVNRAQVSFGSEESHKVHQEYSRLFGKSYQMGYDPITGSLSRQVRSRKGQLLSDEQFNHQTGVKTLTEIDKKTGARTVTTEAPFMHSLEKIDPQGRQTYYLVTVPNGDSKEVISDYEKGRIVENTVTNNYHQTRVFDIKTGQEVFAGPLANETKYDATTNTVVTQNMVTKRVLRRERYKRNGDLVFDITYSPETGHITSEKTFDSVTKNYIENQYRADGNNNRIVKTIVSAKKGRDVLTTTFNPDGSIKERTRSVERPSSDVIWGIYDYYPQNPESVSTETLYLPDATVVRRYKMDPNVRETEDTYDKSKNIRRSVLYQPDGKKMKEVRRYNADGVLTAFKEYNKSGSLIKQTLFSLNSTDVKEEYYNSLEEKDRTVIKDMDGRVKQMTRYYAGGVLPRSLQVFDRANGVCTYYEYDKEGKVINSQKRAISTQV